MPDYIEREAAEIAMCDACEYACKPHKRASGQSLITAEDCRHLRDLAAIPAADVAPVVHARWYKDPTFDGFYYCSHCYTEFEGDAQYCGNCGALMDESEDEE